MLETPIHRETFSELLDLELEKQGWKARERHFHEACAAASNKDWPAYTEAMRKFNEGAQS